MATTGTVHLNINVRVVSTTEIAARWNIARGVTGYIGAGGRGIGLLEPQADEFITGNLQDLAGWRWGLLNQYVSAEYVEEEWES